MRNRQEGLIYTNENCIGCNKCVMECPIPGANRSIIENGRNRIIVDDTKCIHCGQCIKACVHNAREYHDDTESFCRDVKNGDISVIIAPSFFSLYPQRVGQVVNYFKSLGVKNVYDGSYGADIATWAYMKYLDEHDEGGVLLQSCPVIVNFVEKNSRFLMEKMIPVQSPAVCEAIYIHKYLGRKEKLAFFGPCIAKKDEFTSSGTNGEISYNITYSHIHKIVDSIIDDFPKECDMEEASELGRRFPMTGGIMKNLENYLTDKFVLSLDNGVNKMNQLSYYEGTLFDKDFSPCVVDVLACEHGCMSGSGMDSFSVNGIKLAERNVAYEKKLMKSQNPLYSRIYSPEEHKKHLYEKFKDLKIEDFSRIYDNRYQPNRIVPEDILDEVFNYMLKETEQKRHIDCKSCGYNSCRELAEGIALGYSKKNNCIHHEKEENERLYLTDVVMKIPNSSSHGQRLNSIITKKESGRYASISFAPSDWELINTRFGYKIGDNALIEFAKLANSFAGEGEVVAHSGGVDFLAIVTKEHLNSFINKISSMEVHPDVENQEKGISINVAIGVYLMQNDEKAVGDVVSRTNIAASIAKNGTKKLVYYDQSMKDSLIESMNMTQAFPAAIANREFVVYYQPKVKIDKRVLVGTEALVRWKGKNGIISPGRFIPLFEKNGFIKQLDFYVLESVCRDLRGWLDKGIAPVCVSANFSKKHFEDESVIDSIRGIVDKYRIPHELIEVEVTETAYEDKKEVLKQVLCRLREEGFSTSIDDFGSGYSSLNLLSNLDFQVLKLDKAFLDPGVGNEKVQNIVQSVITMAKKLDMKVVAEGVEREEELEMLQKFSCDIIQGYYFDRPMPAEEFEKRLIDEDYYKS